MTKIESIQSKIIGRMQDVLTNEQLQRLENVLAIEFHGIEVQEECTQLVTSEVHWQKILRTFIASKRIENCSPGTLERYNDCVVKLVTALNKRLQDITTNDIRYYLAVYQEQRKISMSYLDTIRRYLSSFFAWVSDEGYISRNPMRRLKKIKVPRMIAEEVSSTGGTAYSDFFDISVTPVCFPVMYKEVMQLLSISRNEVI